MRRLLCILMLLAAAAGPRAFGDDPKVKPIFHLGFDGAETKSVDDAAAGLTGLVRSSPNRQPILGTGDAYEGVYGYCARFQGEDSGSIQVAGVPINPAAGTLSFFYKPLMSKPTITRRYGVLRAALDGLGGALSVELAASASYDEVAGLQVLGAHLTATGLGFEARAGSPVQALDGLLTPGWHHVMISWRAPREADGTGGRAWIHLDGKHITTTRYTKGPVVAGPRKATIWIGEYKEAGVLAPRGCVDELMLFDAALLPETVRRLALRLGPASRPARFQQGVTGSVRRLVPGKKPTPGVPFTVDDIRPLGGAEVWIFKGRLEPLKTADRKHPALVRVVRSAADGAYRVPLPPGTYTVVVRHKGRFILHDYEVDAATGKTYWKSLSVKKGVWAKQIIVDVSQAVPVG